MPRPDWSFDHVLILRRVYGSKDNEWIAAHLDRNVSDVSLKASELALRKNKGKFKGNRMPRWLAKDVFRLRILYPMTPNIEIAKLLDRSEKSVRSKALALGLKKNLLRRQKAGRESVTMRRDRQSHANIDNKTQESD